MIFPQAILSGLRVISYQQTVENLVITIDRNIETLF